ncbi:molybdenum cofactor biosynthesis protein A [Anaerohalosphaera lusitana]|uniref:Molybdenum cofactor biosynthesis protein A n=1 Tax=Anaerohalosphaera lusitana TaxID=1936003 RepID=A0A1U9NLF7_9BACT|nr:AmmeMemoRadiSam system radical SAM enzyme [Anaerohalosphaera lusitana]AQT68637.1 molybdenum cofactor biosynthesis protein A [Anaerohalosphaera lusitana]
MTTSKEQLKRAVLWQPESDNKARCYLCNFRCLIPEGKYGHCAVRQNVNGTLRSLNYDSVCAANPDPIEKKPLFHFQPGTRSFSIACPGCNFQCTFCQNWQISQMALKYHQLEGEPIPPEKIVAAAQRSSCCSIAYTYTEPTIFMELCEETGKLAKQQGLTNVFVSNGYMTKEAVDFSAEWLDGINIDLKAFSDKYYKDLCNARLQPVLETIKYIAKETDIWVELTTLIVPDQNDSDDELKALAEFIANEAGPEVPWHISRFFPAYEMDGGSATPPETLERAMEIGKQAGLKYIYVGNLPGSNAESTFCPSCGEKVIDRISYIIRRNNIKHGACPSCSEKIPGFELG